MHEGMFRSLYRIRRVEEEIARIYPSDKIKSPVHLSIGQEAVSVGVCEALRPDDVVFGTYRSHAYYLAKGGDLKKMVAELFGKATGCAKGKGGSMHLVDAAHGVMGASAVVGTTIPNAVGYAYALRLQGRDSIVVSFFGDGATDEGVFYESLNFAALKQLPIIFVCENNFYAIHTHLLRRHKDANLCGRVSAYGVPAEQIGDNDILKINERAKSVAGLLRGGQSGPFFLECLTYRWKEHVGPAEDFHLGYRSREEARPWMEGDQLLRLAALIPSQSRERIEAEVEAEIREAIASAEEDPFPDARELLTDVIGD
ncbi:MAG: thiamine pyrophosphate-dependent dehydrogenase E1 component subunit alpha [Candidatus Binatia bacterium]